MPDLKHNPIPEVNTCLYGTEHIFAIIPGSGAKTGTPTWKCKKCKRKVISS